MDFTTTSVEQKIIFIHFLNIPDPTLQEWDPQAIKRCLSSFRICCCINVSVVWLALLVLYVRNPEDGMSLLLNWHLNEEHLGRNVVMQSNF